MTNGTDTPRGELVSVHRAELRAFYERLKECQTMLQSNGVRYSWLDPYIAVAKERSEEPALPSEKAPTRNEVLEEAAHVCDERAEGWGNLPGSQFTNERSSRAEDETLAKAIRALKNAAPQSLGSSASGGDALHQGTAAAPHAQLVRRLRVLAEYAPDPDIDYARVLNQAADALSQVAATPNRADLVRNAERYNFLRVNYPRMIISICCGTYQGQTIEEAETRLDKSIALEGK